MKKRVCLLTGASGLLGSAFVERFAGEYDIAAVHFMRLVQFATQTQDFVDPLYPDEPKTDSPSVFSIRADLSKTEEIDRVVDEALGHFGQVDLLVHGAAVRWYSNLLGSRMLECAEMLLSINLLASARLCVALARKSWSLDPEENIRSNRNVINVSSTAGQFVYPDQGQSLYASSKAALNHLTYHMASEFWDLGIRVNAVAPDTFPGRVATAEVLDAIHRLDSSDQTGQILSIYREPAS